MSVGCIKVYEGTLYLDGLTNKRTSLDRSVNLTLAFHL